MKKIISLFLSTIVLLGCNKSQQIKKYHMHEEGRVGGFKITVNSVSNETRIGNETFYIETEQNYVVINFDIYNTRDSDGYMSEGTIHYYHNGVQYSLSNAGAYIFDHDSFTFIKNVPSKTEMNLSVVFEIPEQYNENDYLRVRETAHSDEYAIFYMS